MGDGRGDAALDAFIALDHRMKDIVTAWQMKAEGVFNDHADAAYDAAVLARLGALHVDVEAWLEPLVAGLPRLAPLRRAAWDAPPRRPLRATGSSSPRRASTATTAPGSSSTRT